MKIPTFPKFTSIDLSIKSQIDSYLNRYKPFLSDLSFNHLATWQHIIHPQITLINDNLCILLHRFGVDFFLEPIGDSLFAETVASCFDYCGKFSSVSESFVAKLINYGNYQVKELPNDFDYVYNTTELAEFQGSKFHAKRNHVKNFTREYPNYSYKNLTAEFKEQALMVFDQWSSTSDPSHNQIISIPLQRQALLNSFANFTAMELTGSYIEVDNKTLGFILGSEINRELFGVRFLYCVPDINGIYQILLQLFCKQIKSKFSLVNLEKDLGIAGLRKMKLSYHPVRILKKYEVTPSC